MKRMEITVGDAPDSEEAGVNNATNRLTQRRLRDMQPQRLGVAKCR
jgi:hypothetical protein